MATGDNQDNRYNVPGLARGMAILSAFSREMQELGAPDLSAKLGLPRSTVFRLLQTLECLGYLVRTEDGRRYRLGISVLQIGFEYLASQDVVEHGRPLIDSLSRQADLPAHLVVRDKSSVIYVACASPQSPFTGVVRVGTRLPAHATVFGRLLMGELTLAELRAVFAENTLERSTSQTPSTIGEMHELIQNDYARGFGVSEGFYEPRISTIAAPVRDDRGRIIAAVGLTIHDAAIDPALIDDGVVEMVIDTAAGISERLGYHGKVYTQTRNNALSLHSRKKEQVS